jgi:hypothetical protein
VWRRGWLPTFAGLNSQSSFLGGPLEKREKRKNETRKGRGKEGRRKGEGGARGRMCGESIVYVSCSCVNMKREENINIRAATTSS